MSAGIVEGELLGERIAERIAERTKEIPRNTCVMPRVRYIAVAGIGCRTKRLLYVAATRATAPHRTAA